MALPAWRAALLALALGGLAGTYFSGWAASAVAQSAPAEAAATQPFVNVIPLPARVELGPGSLPITRTFSVALAGHSDARLHRAATRFLQNLSRQTGIRFSESLAAASAATLVVDTAGADKEVVAPGEDESYVLDVTASGAKLSAPNPLGALHGLQTFLQLVSVSPSGFVAPAIHIEDKPRFEWRGLMLDVSRHFMPVANVERTLDAMEAVKLNVFHWHLSDNQGIRVESKTFPKLQEFGTDGHYYTQEEIRGVIEYARERGICVIPEFDVPGHATAVFSAYPDLASAPGPYPIERQSGIFDPAMDPTREQTYKFLDKFFGEMAALFPGPYFHVGGDEVNGKQWNENPKIQAFMKSHNLKTNVELQTYFTQRVGKIVAKHRKIMVGWDEVLAPGLPKDSIIQSWRGPDALAAAARQGYRGILSNGFYLDLMWPASQHYAVDPMSGAAATLSPEESARILGGEACLWSEFVTPENLDLRLWPRTTAIAERLWSPQDVRDVNSMYRRIDAENLRLALAGSRDSAAPLLMLERMAGSQNIGPLQTLAAAAEPVKNYVREELAEKAGITQSSLDPMNRAVDAVSPESNIARQFSDDVDAFIASHFADTEAESRIRELLNVWQRNDAQLAPLLQQSYLLKELAPLSANLAAIATVGSGALDVIDSRQLPAGPWLAQEVALIAPLEQPQADLLLMEAPAVQKLVEAAAAAPAVTAPIAH
ncbi:MAG: family 20 glycosylhydrolase [Candidatus Acidiferrales bacterium]